jgi:radical SAM superfamily enzyme YgiQ (UPF0313 family)
LNILFVQLPVPALVATEVTGNIPLAAGSLIMHARSRGIPAASSCTILPYEITNRAGDAHVIDAIIERNPDIVCFSCAVWNIERTRYVAENLKSRSNRMSIWFGGPEIASDSTFLSDACFDLAVEGEGEHVFELLLQGCKPHEVRGLMLPGNHRTTGSIVPQQIPDLSSIHDPFMAGIVTSEDDKVVLAELYRGCRYGCSYCRYQKGRSGPACSRSREHIAELFSWCRATKKHEMYLLDPSFEQRHDFSGFLTFLAEVNNQPHIPLFVELRLDVVDAPIAAKVKQAGIRSVEGGLQTINPIALRKAGRRVNLEKFVAGAHALLDLDIDVCIDIMTGLPGDTPEGFMDTISFVKKHDLHRHVHIFRTQVFPGTRLRRQAPSLAIRYEDKPPYLMLETPTWSGESLEVSVDLAEKELGISNNPDERPVIPAFKEIRAIGIQLAVYKNSEAVYFYGFDLANSNGRRALEGEKFTRASNTVSLWVENSEYPRDGEIICKAVKRCIDANPFSSICIMLGVQPESPLDLFDKIDDLLEETIPSHYLPRLYPSTYTDRPQRRLFACLPASKKILHAVSWLDDLRCVAEIIWMARCETKQQAVSHAQKFQSPHNDFLFLDTGPAISIDTKNDLFSALAATAPSPEMILLPGLDLHWEFISYLEKPASYGKIPSAMPPS